MCACCLCARVSLVCVLCVRACVRACVRTWCAFICPFYIPDDLSRALTFEPILPYTAYK